MTDSTRSALPDREALRVLVDRPVERDPDAWEELYRRSYRRLFGFARRRLFDHRAAEDAVRETMARALDNIDRFTWQGAGFDAWLYGIARNVLLEHARTRHRTVSLVEEDRATPDRGQEEHAVASAETAAMRHAFDRLSPDDRELLKLRVQGGLSSEDVGLLLGKRPGAVRMCTSAAQIGTSRGKLRKAPEDAPQSRP